MALEPAVLFGLMCVEIIHYQSDLTRIRVHRRKLLTKASELALGALLVDLPDSPSRERFDRRQQHARTQFLVLIVLFGYLAFAHRSRQQRIANQETGSLIETHHGKVPLIGLGVEP